MNRALGVLNGQILQAVDIEPADGRTRFTFDLGCSLLTYPYPPDSSDDEPDTQWYLISRSGPGLSVRGDGTYEASDRHARLADKDWLPIGTPVQVRE
jgi:hypothetical protein